MSLRYAAYEYEKRIRELEADKEDLIRICKLLWYGQFSPMAPEDKRAVNAAMRKHGIEVYP